MSSVILARSANEIEQLREPWERLFSAGNYTFFQDYRWNLLAARYFAGREEPCVAYAETAGGEAIVPAALRDGCLVLLGETLFDYRDVLVDGDGEALELAWAELAKFERPLRVTAVREGAARERWAELEPSAFCNAPGVSPEDISAGEFRAQHTGIARHLRRLLRAGGRIHRHPGSDWDAVRRILEQKAEYAEPDNLLRDPVRREFLNEGCRLHAGQAEAFTMEVDGALAAGLLTFREGGTRRFYTITFDRKWARYSPGNALLFEAVCGTLAEGLACDFMTGEQAYKLRFATRSTPLYRVHAPAAALASPPPIPAPPDHNVLRKCLASSR